LYGAADLEFAITIPSYPTLTSVISPTPFSRHLLISFVLIALDAFVKSGCCVPTPAQKSFNPPPEPVVSILGVLKSVDFPNFSATTIAKG